ncbi:glycosyltransferase family 2 protein [Olivibacter sitiensis]|uniref:glycosyltransferase family 2 protein n=1 Tax=Olivibacter sitiensis TaxID=376470 RepID=UPI00041D4063|nr:glycosyltransferase family A protein [Olivibacter sitiensis]
MEQGPTYTIAIPAYKGKYLHDCIASVLAQSMADFELIVVDDCSPDDIQGIVEAFPAGSIRYYRNEINTGARNVVDNWNKCLSLATGQFFVLMGDDDMMEPNYLEEFSKLIAQYPGLDVYHCRCKVMDEQGKPLFLSAPCPSFETVYDHILERLYMRRTQYISDFVYDIDALRSHGGFFFLPQAWGSDDITAFRAAMYKGIGYTSAVLFNYRQSSITITTSGNVEDKVEAVNMQEVWLRDFLERQPTNPLDEIVHKQICNEFEGLMLRKKTEIIRQDLEQGGFLCLMKWVYWAYGLEVPIVSIIKLYLLSKVRK